ncbi:L-lysine exporter family protein LysE/ArgO [Malonomonas rubra DSM 5091]|uniref:L-lysine exporter family protein LysE/ArgO n=1 Tax=Malonomonas rubra DSM 5091 TaxID=1122189 RepID=A0A1M6MQK0_MALRU|nr:LysE/ArgO family amino acid transporter [Malonomonas rubra]SHJ85676.1 L-lysine exporter family protein LysE/ArgO [Malonomonas rubra DSM 5091]
MVAFLQGLGLGGGLIIAIGAQNAFVLSQGVRRNYPLQTALVCSLCDAILMIIGISGVGALVATNPQLAQTATWGGAAFLFWYGSRSFRSALQGGSLQTDAEKSLSRRKLLVTTLALTLLNPHVYLDTIVLVGSISGQLADSERLLFGAGAISASVLWFFSLSFGAGLLAPLFRKQIAWRCLDGFVCLTMWTIAVSLIWPEVSQLIA